MKIFVEIPDKPKLEVLCRPSDPIIIIKSSIFESHGLFGNFYRLYINGFELDNDLAIMADYGIQEGSVVRLFPRKVFTSPKIFFRLLTDDCEWTSIDYSINILKTSLVNAFFLLSLFSINIYAKTASLFIICCHVLVLCTSVRRFFPHSLHRTRQNNNFQVANRGEWIYGFCGNFCSMMLWMEWALRHFFNVSRSSSLFHFFSGFFDIKWVVFQTLNHSRLSGCVGVTNR